MHRNAATIKSYPIFTHYQTLVLTFGFDIFIAFPQSSFIIFSYYSVCIYILFFIVMVIGLNLNNAKCKDLNSEFHEKWLFVVLFQVIKN